MLNVRVDLAPLPTHPERETVPESETQWDHIQWDHRLEMGSLWGEGGGRLQVQVGNSPHGHQELHVRTGQEAELEEHTRPSQRCFTPAHDSQMFTFPTQL